MYGSDLSARSNATNGQSANTQTIADFQQFVTEFRENESFIYRDRLRANCLRKEWTLEVEMGHLIGWREDLASRCRSEPGEVLPLVRLLSLVVAFEPAQADPRLAPESSVRDWPAQRGAQPALPDGSNRGGAHREAEVGARDPAPAEVGQPVDAVQGAGRESLSPSVSPKDYTDDLLRQATNISRLVRLPGIVISASVLSSRAIRLHLTCKSCRHVTTQEVQGGFSGFQLPRKCIACVS